MSDFVYVFSRIPGSLVTVLEIAMLIRVVLSWMPISEENRFADFVYGITEPFIYPVRRLFDHFGLFEESVLDVPFFVTYLALAIISIFM